MAAPIRKRLSGDLRAGKVARENPSHHLPYFSAVSEAALQYIRTTTVFRAHQEGTNHTNSNPVPSFIMAARPLLTGLRAVCRLSQLPGRMPRIAAGQVNKWTIPSA